MTLSVWRYAHLWLAVTTAAFLLVASVTGVILALEPITHQSKGFAIAGAEDLPLDGVVSALREQYDEVFSLEVEPSGFVKASVLTEDFETLDLYIDPRSGKSLGAVAPRPAIYSFSTNLHRSLFLKSVGRIFVGLVSLLLAVIAVSGIVLIAQRQGGIRKFFTRVRKDAFEMRYHVVFSRWMLVPILVLALTGVYLSAEKFNLLPEGRVVHNEENIGIAPAGEPAGTPSGLTPEGVPLRFESIRLRDVRSVAFPFSDDPGEYFEVALRNREIRVSPATGALMSEADYPFVALASRFSFAAHTGHGSIVWSLILLVASASVLFFMYTGFVMAVRRLRRTRKREVVPAPAEYCDVVLLVGSETGNTFSFARRLFAALEAAGQRVFIGELNAYRPFPEAKHLVVLAATYGDGEAPTNARKFPEVAQMLAHDRQMTYSVVGFGSTDYPHFCRFAELCDTLLAKQPGFRRLLPLVKIDNQSDPDFLDWTDQWSKAVGIPLELAPAKKDKPPRERSFTVVERTDLNSDDTFILRLRIHGRIRFQSGDLLAIQPVAGGPARQYSIARMGREIVLSIRRHANGKCSTYLSGLKAGDRLRGSVETNAGFHLPTHTPAALLVANGTGIAPFLGMLQNTNGMDVSVYWGGRTAASAELYAPWLSGLQANGTRVRTCFSREADQRYVQDLLLEDHELVAGCLRDGGTVMICGSLAMQEGVLETLENVLTADGSTLSVDAYRQNGQVRTDCY